MKTFHLILTLSFLFFIAHVLSSSSEPRVYTPDNVISYIETARQERHPKDAHLPPYWISPAVKFRIAQNDFPSAAIVAICEGEKVAITVLCYCVFGGQTLDEIGAQGKRLILLNKIDQCNADIRANLTKSYPSAILICAIEASDGAMLRDRIIKFFVDRLVSERLSIPYNRQNVLAELRGEVVVVEEKYGDEIEVTVRATTEILAKLKSRLAKNKFFEER